MGRKHFLEIAHEGMYRARMGHLWAPGSTTWTHWVDVSERTIRRAQKDGYLSKGTGIPYLTRKGWRTF